jgi:phage-related protein
MGIIECDGQIPIAEAAALGGEFKTRFAFLTRAVMDLFGFALYLAQDGRKHERAKPLRGFGSAGVLEVVEDWERSTYRAVYTVRFEGAVFVLHVFQKKSKRGAATPKADIDLIRERLRVAEQIAKELQR